MSDLNLIFQAALSMSKNGLLEFGMRVMLHH